MKFQVIISVFVTWGVTLQGSPEEGFCGPHQTALLENMTASLTSSKIENSKAFSELGEGIGINLKVHGEDLTEDLKELRKGLREDLQEITKGFGEELKGLGQNLKKILNSNEEMRQEKLAQHQEMMLVFNELLKTLGNGVNGTEEKPLTPTRDCAALYKSGQKKNGVYRIKPDGLNEAFDVFCDMENDGGGWTVFQRRGPKFGTGTDFFYKPWIEYKQGFGNLTGEHWLGNDRISALTTQGAYELHIEMLDYQYSRFFANYKKFVVEGEERFYRLHAGIFSGNDHDSMAYHNGMRFSTWDKDNDLWNGNCAESDRGAWWYNSCYHANLNAKRVENSYWLSWYNTRGVRIDLASVQMKTRPVSF